MGVFTCAIKDASRRATRDEVERKHARRAGVDAFLMSLEIGVQTGFAEVRH